jgi:exosortase
MEPSTDTLVRDGVVEEVCQRLPNKLLFGVLLAAWVLLFVFLGNGTFGYQQTASLFEWMWPLHGAANSDFDSNLGWLLPLAVAALFWMKRWELLELPLASWTPGLGIVASAALLHLLGYMVQQPRISIVALFVGIYGLMGLAWGPRFLRRSFFPFAFFVFAMPLGSYSATLTFNLRLLVTMLAESVANLLGIEVVRVGTGLFDAARTYQFDVAPACSGIRSLMAVLFLCTVYGYVVLGVSWRWVLVLLSAFPLAVLGNLLRLLVIVLVADLMGQDSGNWVHENWFFSLLPYVPPILGVFFLCRWLESPRKEASQKEVKP